MESNKSIAIGAVFFILAIIAALSHLWLLIAIILQRRHASSARTAYASNSRQNGPRSSTAKKNLSSYFYVSLWISLIFNLLTAFLHDGPSILAAAHVHGSNVASVFAWLARCTFYSSLFHFVLIVFSSYCNRLSAYSTPNAATTVRAKCFASRLKAVMATLISWLLSVALATVVKYYVCEYQFDPNEYGYKCVDSIQFSNEIEKPTSQANTKGRRILIYTDGPMIGLVAVWLIYGNWMIRKISLSHRRRVDQAESVISDASFSASLDAICRQRRAGPKLHAYSNRLVALSLILILRSVCYLLMLSFGRNRWHSFVFTIIDFLYLIACPITYVLLTKSMREAFVCWSGRQTHGIQSSGRVTGSNEDDHSLFSFSPATAPFSSAADRISANSAFSLRPIDRSPFTTNYQGDQSPSITADHQRPPKSTTDNHSEPQRNLAGNRSPSRFLNANNPKNKSGSSTHSLTADVHRSDIYAISSFRCGSELKQNTNIPLESKRIKAIDKRLDEVRNDRRSSEVLKKKSRRPVRFRQSIDRNDQPCEYDGPSQSMAITDVDSTVSETASLQLTRGIIALKKKARQDSMENCENNGSLKERSAAARRFVEAYEAMNSRFNHSLVAGDAQCPRHASFVEDDFSQMGFSPIDEAGVSVKRHRSYEKNERENGFFEKRCHQDG